MVTAYWFLVMSASMFGIGLYGLTSRRNVLRMLLSAEVIFNAALLALLTVSSISPEGSAAGGVLALLAISIAAAEVGVIVSVAVLLFQVKGSVDVYELSKSKG